MSTMSGYRKHMPRPARLLFSIILIYGFFWVKGWPRTYDDEELPAIKRPQQQTSLGPHLVDHDQLIVSVTTTALDVSTKVAPLILNTPEEDHGTLLLFSDLQTQLGRWPVFDVIFRYSADFRKITKELKRYKAQVDYARSSIPLDKLSKADAEEEKKEMATLDKYKILQTMAAAWEYRPDRSWYVFAGDETYINRPGLLDWLSQHDPQAKHFFASAPTPDSAMVPDPFAFGGTSFILSRQVMHGLFEQHKDFIKNWEKQITDHASAFDLVASVLNAELKVGITSAWPAISGFDPSTIPFSPATWCEPVLMLQHISPDIGTDLLKMEREWASSQTQLRFADLWNRFMAPENLDQTRADWDNLSSESSNSRWNILFEGEKPDSERAATGEDSADACRVSCDNFKWCMQWSYSSIPQKNWNDNPDTKCHLSSSIRFGRHTEPTEWNVDGKQSTLTWRSGWRKDKFMAWANQQRCKEQHQ
jgi:hypothetical protein